MLVSSAKRLNNNLSEQFGRSFIYNLIEREAGLRLIPGIYHKLLSFD